MQSLPLPPRLRRLSDPTYDVRRHEPDVTFQWDCFVVDNKGNRIVAKWLGKNDQAPRGEWLIPADNGQPGTQIVSAQRYPRWLPRKD